MLAAADKRWMPRTAKLDIWLDCPLLVTLAVWLYIRSHFSQAHDNTFQLRKDTIDGEVKS